MITGGSVTIEDGVKKLEEYAPARKVSVTINFAVPENDSDKGESYLAATSGLANDQVKRLLGQPVPNAEVRVAPAAATPKEPKTTKEPKTPAAKPAEAPKAPEKTKADLEAEMGLTPGGPVETVQKPAAPAEDELGDMLSEPAKVAVTDKEISDACIGKADHMKTVAGWEPKKIRLLVEEFVGHTGAKFAQVPAERRHEFLKRLQELK